MSDQIHWNRRTKAAIAVRKFRMRVRARILGQGLSIEEEQWSPLFALEQSDNGRIKISYTTGDTHPRVVSVENCPICAALVRTENRAYHERWHIAGSV